MRAEGLGAWGAEQRVSRQTGGIVRKSGVGGLVDELAGLRNDNVPFHSVPGL